MYHNHFGLNRAPFNITPDPGFFFKGNKRSDILDALIYAVKNGDGIVKVTGEVGSGKTMLCRMLVSRLPEHVEVIYLVNPTLSREQIIYTIASELGLQVNGQRVDEVLRNLYTELIDKHKDGKQVVLLVEEAQAMSLETLEEIRLISNLETAQHKLLQIVLFGQPELDEHLNLTRMRQLKERITNSFTVPPLTKENIPLYLMFRMRAAGYRGPDMFSAGAVKLIGQASKGILRRISILADKSLLAAYAENAYEVKPNHVKLAIADCGFPQKTFFAMNKKRVGVAIGTGTLFLLTLGVAWRITLPSEVPVKQTTVATDTVITKSPSLKMEFGKISDQLTRVESSEQN